MRLESLADLRLHEWATTDAEWFTEVWTALTAYREGQAMRGSVEQTRQKQAQC